MDKKEYNKRVRYLVYRVQDGAFRGNLDEETLKKEFFEVYNADRKFDLASAKSIKNMFRLNQRFRFMPLHLFGIEINLTR